MTRLHGVSIAQVGNDHAIDTTKKIVSKNEVDLIIDSAKKEIVQTLKNQIDSLKLFILANNEDDKDLVGVLTMANKKVPMYKENVRESNKYVDYTKADTCEYYNDSLYKVSTIYNRVYYRKIIGDTIAYVIRKYRLQGLFSKKMRKMVCKCIPLKQILVDSILIDSVIVRIESGEILQIQVFSKNKRFTNTKAPILVISKRFTKIDRLYEDGKTGNFIILNQVLLYASYKSYFPNDDNYVFNSENKKLTLTKSSGINSLLDMRLYSDALGVFGGKSNGLVQTDISGRFAVGHIIIPNSGLRFFKYIGVNLTASKFDSKVATTIKDSTEFNRTKMLQKSWLNANVYTTLLGGWLAKGSSDTWGVDLGAGFDLSQLGDNVDTTTTVSTYIMYRPYVDFKLSDNFNFNISCTALWHFNKDTEKLNDQKRDKVFFQPQLGLSWSPKGSPNSRIFTRVKYVREKANTNDEYVQVQFGYSLLLSGVVNKE